MSECVYTSTRLQCEAVTASQAILKGISSEGGLFVPQTMPVLDKDLEDLIPLDYKALAYEILKLFLSDYTKEELMYCIDHAYDSKFDTALIAPVVKNGGVYFLELFHGPTLAFKDMALSILPYLLKTAARKNGMEKEIVILAATSGDTGKAALEGFADVEGIRIIVFYPENGVSPVQKLQMVTQQGANTKVAAIAGNFDDAQKAVKDIFTDQTLAEELNKEGFVFSSANSINIGRLVPQVVYYFYAYSQLVKNGEIQCGEAVNFIVPTGNFGNILAGYYAKELGLPVKSLLCASNDNKVLYDFFQNGRYDRNRPFYVTASPSMDILISSNLERLLYHISKDEKTVADMMRLLSETGAYDFLFDTDAIKGMYATEEETLKAIKEVYEDTGYVMDTHTAVAYAAMKKMSAQIEGKNIIVSTASPYKFAQDVLGAIDARYKQDDPFKLMAELEKIWQRPVPAGVKDIEKREIRHTDTIEKNEIKQYVKRILLNK